MLRPGDDRMQAFDNAAVRFPVMRDVCPTCRKARTVRKGNIMKKVPFVSTKKDRVSRGRVTEWGGIEAKGSKSSATALFDNLNLSNQKEKSIFPFIN